MAQATLVVEIGPLSLYLTERVEPGMLAKMCIIVSLLILSAPDKAEFEMNYVSLDMLEDIVPILIPTTSDSDKVSPLDFNASSQAA